MNRKHLPSVLLALALLASAAGAAAADAGVIRHKGAANFPIAMAVEVPAGKTVVYVSGAVPPVVDPKADPNTLAAYGDTRTQTLGVLQTIEKNLKSIGLTMGDVVKMQVFLAGDPAKGGQMDFAGMMESYGKFFGTPQQPNLPARSTVQVAGLVRPYFLVEIEVTAVRP